MKLTTLQGEHSVYRLTSSEPAFFGRVCMFFQATDVNSGRGVLLKVFRPDLAEPESLERFYREIDAVRHLQHPNILPLLDYGHAKTDGDVHFLVVPYCGGGNVRNLLAARSFVPLPTAMPLLRQIAVAIDYAHSRGVIHGDIKPENILLSEDHKTALLADYGMGRHFDTVVGLQITMTQAVWKGGGTAAYLSPEQLSANTQSPRTDIYSFGLVAYELLVGRLPFDVSAPLYRQLTARVQGVLLDPREANPTIDEQVRVGLLRALEVDPSRRPATASELCEQLAPSKHWDIFLAYSAQERAVAETLCAALSSNHRVFFDQKCLLPGDDWDTTLANAQREASVTVVLVSGNTETAYYQREEVASAIQMAREDADAHRVVPVLIGDVAPAALPYGLRLKQALSMELGREAEVAAALDKLVKELKARRHRS